MTQFLRCAAQVHKRDTYRRTGRTKSGFEMHYTKQRCSRQATHGEWCWQHRDGYAFRYEDNWPALKAMSE